jgi:hypothetical protein
MSMESTEDQSLAGRVVPLAAGRQSHNSTWSDARPSPYKRVSFDRSELSQILALYGRKVASGEWRDYAIDFSTEKAVFSIYRRACEFPLFRIEKVPKLARKQGAYSVLAATGRILKRGHDLAPLLAALDKKLKLVSG